MLAPQAEIAAERREAREARERLGGSVECAVERIALDGCGEDDERADRDPAANATIAPEAEVVEQVAGSRDAGPEARGDSRRERGQHEQRRGDGRTGQREGHPPACAALARTRHPERDHRDEAEDERDAVRLLITVSSALGRTAPSAQDATSP